MDASIEKFLAKKKIVILKFLNRGSFSECFLGVIHNQQKAVVKILNTKNQNENEIAILTQTKHYNIL